MKWGVVVLAGGHVTDPLKGALGTSRKALASLGGQTSLARTLSAVRDAGFVECVTVSGEDVKSQVKHGYFVLEHEGQFENASVGAKEVGKMDAILFLPADTPFLEPASLIAFTSEIEKRVGGRTSNWLAAGLVTLEDFEEAFPRLSTKPIRLKEGPHVSGALFASTPAAFRKAHAIIKAMSRSRKSQFSMLRRLGLGTFVKYVLRAISFDEAERRLSQLFGAEVMLFTGCDASTAADFDDVADFNELLTRASRGTR